ncbi:retrovirus-related pol polyprotein from transposon TNT 1-94 [Tanacetum coccineum]
MDAIRIFLAFAKYMNFIVFQMDVKSVFLNGKLKEEVYVKQPLGFESSEFPDYVCKLDKAFYGLKQASRACMMGELSYFLGLQIKQDDKGISICQEKYTRDLLKKYKIFDSSSVKTPMVPPNNLSHDLAGKPVNETLYRGMIGSLVYLTASRYLKGTSSVGRWYLKCLGFDLKGYSDSDYAGCNMDRQSTSSACQILRGKLVCWSAKKQKSVAMSSAEVEYVAAAGVIAISSNLVLHSRTKQIDIRYHCIRDHILKGDIELHVIPTEYQLADIFTNPLDEPTFTRLKAELGMLNID